MGLAEPRKRLKISHDPNNTAWSSSTNSYGQRLMLSQGWKAGEGLGAANRRGFNSYENAKLKVSFKDDNLGLGASLKSKDVEHSRTGLDAFQGLLGRLNGKSEVEVEAAEKKVEDRKLVMFAQSKWGGMVFVPGGLLVQRDDFKLMDEQTQEQREFKALRNDAEAIAKAKWKKKEGGEFAADVATEDDEAAAKARRKQERAEKRRRRKAEEAAGVDAPVSEEASAVDGIRKEKKKKKKQQETKSLPTRPEETSTSDADAEGVQKTVTIPRPMVRNGRQLLRGRNIAAKKMAFADAKGLDEIFMRKR